MNLLRKFNDLNAKHISTFTNRANILSSIVSSACKCDPETAEFQDDDIATNELFIPFSIHQ